MPIELGVWRIDKGVKEVPFEPMALESRLEDILEKNISIVAPHLMVIGRQVRTSFGKPLDILAIDVEGNLALLELKRHRTDRDIVAQVLDYGSWIRTLRDEEIASIYNAYMARYHSKGDGASINEAFCTHFKVRVMPEELNENHELIIVAGSLDPGTERIVAYLSEHHDVNINAVFFRFFKDENREYLSRVWFREPSDQGFEVAAEKTISKWNGEYYVSFGADDRRDWQEAVKYGFVSGGGGLWYSNTLSLLQPDARIWVNLPGIGYVGVGCVLEERVPVEEFMVPGPDGRQVPISDLPTKISHATKFKDDPAKAEYLVRVEWAKTVLPSEAIKERGFFGNQNTVARPTTPKWQHTIERLKARFGIT